MENLIQLIVFFAVYFLLALLFKGKKKTEQKLPERKPQKNVTAAKRKMAQREEFSYDSLKSLENKTAKAEKLVKTEKAIPSSIDLQPVSERASSIMEKLRDRRNIQDYFIISEIISRPKSIRRRF